MSERFRHSLCLLASIQHSMHVLAACYNPIMPLGCDMHHQGIEEEAWQAGEHLCDCSADWMLETRSAVPKYVPSGVQSACARLREVTGAGFACCARPRGARRHRGQPQHTHSPTRTAHSRSASPASLMRFRCNSRCELGATLHIGTTACTGLLKTPKRKAIKDHANPEGNGPQRSKERRWRGCPRQPRPQQHHSHQHNSETGGRYFQLQMVFMCYLGLFTRCSRQAVRKAGRCAAATNRLRTAPAI